MSPALVLDPCPCGAGRSFGQCCGPVLSGKQPAETAEALMRSRYTAFARGDREHLLRSWHPDTRPASLDLPSDREWRSLEILAATGGGANDTTGSVRFVARFRDGPLEGAVDELSQFVRHDSRWVYASGVQTTA